MRYDAAEYKNQIDGIHRKKRKVREKAGLKGNAWAEKMGEGDKLRPIYTVCFYHGAGKWTGPRSLKDIMDFGENSAEWEKRFSDYTITVINAEDAEVAKTVGRRCGSF